MTLLVLVILGVMWLLVLLPPFLRSIRDGRPSDSVVSFRRQLTVLERATPGTAPLRAGGPMVRSGVAPSWSAGAYGGPVGVANPSYRRRQQAERRRAVLATLAGLTAVSVVLAFVTGAALIEAVAGLACLALAAFVYLLLQRQAAAPRRRSARPPVGGADDAWF